MGFSFCRKSPRGPNTKKGYVVLDTYTHFLLSDVAFHLKRCSEQTHTHTNTHTHTLADESQLTDETESFLGQNLRA